MKKLILLFALLLALPAGAAPVSLATISNYLNTLKSEQTTFVQTNGDGSKATGTLFIKRPGRARFEYDRPNDETLVLVSGGQVAIFDGRASGKPEQYPLKRTPLNLILARNIDLTRASMVTGHGEDKGRTVVAAQDPGHPEYGKIYLYFETAPLRLSEWLIVSETGEHTQVKLAPFKAKANLSPVLFNISQEIDRRQ
jgi:outer membrane lipoprotein-sorting protein